MRTRRTQKEHDDLVEAVIGWLIEDEGFDADEIMADLPNSDFDRPGLIHVTGYDQSYMPDVVAEDDDEMVLIEVETPDTIHHPHTEDQWTTFAMYADVEDATFMIVVPRGYAEAVEDRLDELEIEAEIMEI